MTWLTVWLLEIHNLHYWLLMTIGYWVLYVTVLGVVLNKCLVSSSIFATQCSSEEASAAMLVTSVTTCGSFYANSFSVIKVVRPGQSLRNGEDGLVSSMVILQRCWWSLHLPCGTFFRRCSKTRWQKMSLHGATGHVAVAELFGTSPKTPFRKKMSFFRNTYFSIKRQKFSTILKMQVWTIYVYIHMGCKPLNKWDAPASRWDICFS